jgi:multiple sugar transport system permease protein
VAGGMRTSSERRPGPRTVRRLGPLLRGLGFHLVALAVAALFLLPLAWLVSGSLRSVGTPPPRVLEPIPDPLAWENFIAVADLVPLLLYLRNSVVVVLVAVPLTLAVASLAGFATSQLREPVRRRLVLLSVLLLMLPVTALWLSRYVLFARVGLVDTLAALIAPAAMGTSPFFVLLYYWTYRRIPPDLFDSARLDGAGPVRVWHAVALPLSRPTSFAVGVLAFVFYWGDVISPVLYLKSEALATLPVGLRTLQQLDRLGSPLLLAGSIVALLPVLLVFLVAQRRLLTDEGLRELGGRA